MTPLKIGDKAPDFTGITQDNKSISSQDLLGKKYVLFFYPKANTPGCTAEACNLRDNYEDFQQCGFELIGVSVDTIEKQKKWSEKNQLPYLLIADTDKKIVNDFGVWGEKKMMGKTYMGIYRTTFIINEKGIIENIITKVNTKDHTSQIL